MNFHVPNAARLGFDSLDHEHDQMVEEINSFGRALDGDDVQDYEQRFARLRDEMETHFHHEEAVMESYDYPGLAVHRAEHQQVLGVLDRLVADCRARRQVVQDDLFACFDTLVRDMLHADLMFKTFLYELGVLT